MQILAVSIMLHALLTMAHQPGRCVTKVAAHQMHLIVTRSRRELVAIAVVTTSRHIKWVTASSPNGELICILVSLLMISIKILISQDGASAKARLCLSSLNTVHEVTWCAGVVNHIGTWLTLLLPHILFILRRMLISRELLECNWRH